MGLALTQVTPPVKLAVELADMRAHLRIDGIDDDDFLKLLIRGATRDAQILTRRQFITATFDYFLDSFPPQFKRNRYSKNLRPHNSRSSGNCARLK